MNSFSIGSRFLLFTAIILVAVVSAVSIVTVNRTEQTLRGAERQHLEQYYEQILSRLELEGLAAQTLSALVASVPPVQESFANQDRARLTEWFGPGFKQLKAEYGVEQFQFHTPPATSFLRIHKLEKFGDDLSSFRQTVVETNRDRQPIRGLEKGVAGLGIRGVVPVFHQQKHIGSVEFGLSFGQKFFDQYKSDQGVDVALYLSDGSSFKPFGTTFGPDGGLLDTAQLKRAFAGEPTAARGQLRGTPVAVYANVVKDYSGKAIGVLEVAADRTFFAAELASIRNTILAVGLAALLIAVLAALFVARGVTRPLVLAARNLEEIAQGGGDLSRRLPVEGKDELARLAGAFNRFVELIADIVGSVSDSAARLSAVVDRFSASAANTHRGMVNQQSETEQIAAAVNEMSATVHEVANNTSQAAAAAVEADRQTLQGQQVVNSAIEAIQAVAREVERVADVISRVDNDSTRIGTVLNVIGDIAEQTNLLALNAAIEAARAGDQGRGFAVVADEVRVLAQRTQKSTEEIREMIESLQKSAKTAVDVMVEGRTRTLESVDQARGAGEALTAIASAVDTINQMNTQIATASEEQSAVADEINRNIARISDVTDNTARDSAETANESVRLVELAEELSRLVRQFRLGGQADLDRDLEAAKAAHLAWKVKLRTFLDGQSSLSQGQAVSDRECAFGKWYFAQGLAQLGNIREMKEIEKPHAEMHALIKRIITLKHEGKLTEAEQEYRKVEPLSRRIVDLIDAIKRQAA